MRLVVNVPLIVAGSLAVLGAGLHGIGGPRSTRMMIHTTWRLSGSLRALLGRPVPILLSAIAALGWWER